MTYQTILVNLPGQATATKALTFADQLAQRHTAHLMGLHIKPPLEVPVSAELPISLELTRLYRDQQEQTEKQVRAVFEQVTDASDYVADWRSIDCGTVPVSDHLVDQGNTADLIIIALGDDESGSVGNRRLAESVLLACGRPVLVIPGQYEASNIAQRIMLAWDGRRESTRAVFGALPMLRHASEVRLHRINQPHQDRHHVLGMTEELANTLSRHGVSLEVQHSDAKSGEIAEELIGYARDMDADTLVMGCYGHGRLREFLLGGTTRRIFEEASIPLLMSN